MRPEELPEFNEGERPSAGKLMTLVRALRALLGRENSAPGTLHTPWGDYQRRVEGTAGDSSPIKFGILVASLGHNSEASMEIWEDDPLAASGEYIDVWDWFLPEEDQYEQGTKVVVTKISGKWYVIQAQCNV